MVVSDQSKAEAIRKVAESVTFHRADVLRALLEYLHAQEALGRGHEVSESEIAMKVMGRGAAFAPESDSAVRTRFVALRKKLDDYYAGEGRQSPVRLDIPRGTYTIRFLPNVQTEVIEPLAPLVVATPSSKRPFLLGAASMLGVVIAGALGWFAIQNLMANREDALLGKAWGGMLTRGSTVSVAIGTPVSFFVRDFGKAELPVGDPTYRLMVPRDPALANFYQKHRNEPLSDNFIFHPNMHSPLWGDAAAASIVSKMFGGHGVLMEQLPITRIHLVALRDRNAVIIGRPEYTDAARVLVPDDGMLIEYSAKDRAVGVHSRAPSAGEPEWRFATGGLRHSYGLITVLESDNASGKRIMMFSGINSDGAEAGARFMTSKDKLSVLDAEFRKRGYEQWPSKYQVVIRTESFDTYSLQTQFDSLRVLVSK